MSQSTTLQAGTTIAASGSKTSVVLAALFGLAIVYVVGFAQPNALHNAFHDSRHSLIVPCH